MSAWEVIAEWVTNIIFPADPSQGNWRALRDDQTNRVMNNLHYSIRLGSKVSRENLRTVSISTILTDVD